MNSIKQRIIKKLRRFLMRQLPLLMLDSFNYMEQIVYPYSCADLVTMSRDASEETNYDKLRRCIKWFTDICKLPICDSFADYNRQAKQNIYLRTSTAYITVELQRLSKPFKKYPRRALEYELTKRVTIGKPNSRSPVRIKLNVNLPETILPGRQALAVLELLARGNLELTRNQCKINSGKGLKFKVQDRFLLSYLVVLYKLAPAIEIANCKLDYKLDTVNQEYPLRKILQFTIYQLKVKPFKRLVKRINLYLLYAVLHRFYYHQLALELKMNLSATDRNTPVISASIRQSAI